jgi:hypothetical protein
MQNITKIKKNNKNINVLKFPTHPLARILDLEAQQTVLLLKILSNTDRQKILNIASCFSIQSSSYLFPLDSKIPMIASHFIQSYPSIQTLKGQSSPQNIFRLSPPATLPAIQWLADEIGVQSK